MTTFLDYLFATTAAVIGYQAVTFLLRFIKTRSRDVLWCLCFALSSCLYALFLLMLYNTQGETSRTAVGLGVLFGMFAMGTYLKAMSSYFMDRSRLIDAGVVVILLMAGVYACLVMSDLAAGTDLLSTERPQPIGIDSPLLPQAFLSHYDITVLTKLPHAVCRFIGLSLLIYLLAAGNVKRDRTIQVGLIISVLFILHNMVTVSLAMDYYVPLIAFMNLIELARLEWRARRGEQLRLSSYEQQVASFDQGLTAHLKLKEIGTQAASLIHDAKNISIANDFKLQEIQSHAEQAGDEQLAEQVRSTRTNNKRLLDLMASNADHGPDGQYAQYAQPLDLNAIVADALAFTAHRLLSHGITVKVTGETTRPVLGDRIKLSQVIINLVNNACDAVAEMPAGWIKIQISEQPQRTVISVSNNGPPIPKPLQEKVFEPFFTTKSGTGGTGMGLKICRDYLKAMGGELALNPDSDVTQFDVVLNPDVTSPATSSCPAGAPGGSRARPSAPPS